MGKSANKMQSWEKNYAENEYLERGAYHIEDRISLRWRPIYYRRNFIVEEILRRYLDKQSVILDIGCGEGGLLETIAEDGFEHCFGIDVFAPFEGKDKVRGNFLELPFKNDSVDVILNLDVMEHIPLQLQYLAAAEIHRVLAGDGVAIVSVPNMAHLKSRLDFLFKGMPWRNKLSKHPGELAAGERIQVLESSGLHLADIVGIHLTLAYDPLPWKLLGKYLTRFMFSHRVPANLCMTNLMVLYKNKRPGWLEFRTPRESPLRNILKEYTPCDKDPTSEAYN